MYANVTCDKAVLAFVDAPYAKLEAALAAINAELAVPLTLLAKAYEVLARQEAYVAAPSAVLAVALIPFARLYAVFAVHEARFASALISAN